jgi:twitching motility protein PilI
MSQSPASLRGQTRTSLQSFQETLLRKLADSSGQGLLVDWLGVGVGGSRLLLSLRYLGEIAPLQPLQRLPRTAPWVLGVASVRGLLTVVADARKLLELPVASLMGQLQGGVGVGLGPAGAEAPGHWLSLNPALGLHAALQVDRLLGLHSVRELTPCPPEITLPGHPALIRCWRDAAGQTWFELDVSVLANLPAFLELREAGASPLTA